MSITIKDIAAAAGVAVGTASRALSGSGSIAPATRDRVLDAAKALNYIPNAQARALRSERTHTIGLLIPDVRNPYFGDLAHFIEAEARAHGFSVLLCSANEDPTLMHDYVRVLRHQRVDGIIAAPFFSARACLEELHDSGIPLVFVDRSIPDLDIPAVVSDTSAAIAAAVTDLHERGARTVGYISGPHDTSTGRERLDEFVRAAATLGVATQIVEGDFQEESGRLGMATLLDSGIDAVVAADSFMTLGALRTCLERQLLPGRDLTLVGFDETPASLLMRPALPLIIQGIEQMGTAAVGFLRSALAGESPRGTERIAATYSPSAPAATTAARAGHAQREGRERS